MRQVYSVKLSTRPYPEAMQMTPSAQQRNASYDELCRQLGIQFEAEIRGGANYDVAVEHEGLLYISGMVPRIQGDIVVKGRVGADASFDDARRAAQVCVLRALAAVRQAAGSLERVARLLRMTVYVQSADDFERHSEVADAASDILYALFGVAGKHTRTSVGVYKLPKNAAVEIDLIVAVDGGARAQD